MQYSIKEIADILNIDTALHDAMIDSFLTDSRSLTFPATTLFFAICTSTNDGHRYIPELYAKGVRNFVVERFSDLPEYGDANFLYVDSPLDALRRIARVHRAKCADIEIIGITGSRGKTTVKEWLNAILADKYHIDRSPRSYNSQIGVPMSVCQISADCDCAIIEAGISNVGEMAVLRDIIMPTIGVFTNLGEEHNEGFPSKYAKCEEKALLFHTSTLRHVVFCADDTRIAHAMSDIPTEKIASWSRCGNSAPLQVRNVSADDGSAVIEYLVNGTNATAKIPFDTNADIENAIHCIAVMRLCLGMEAAEVEARLATLPRIDTRIDVRDGVNNCVVICDNYTCDVDSLEIALDFMSRRATADRSRTVVLSDLVTPPYKERETYRRAISLLAGKGVKRFIAIGSKWLEYRDRVDADSRIFATTSDFLEHTTAGSFENEQILLKGAPGFGFHLIEEMLQERQHETVLEVNLDNLAHNFTFFRSHVSRDTGIVCMVKASGYGAGSYEIAKTLQDRGAAYLAVAVLDEGVDLRKAGITMPIMVLNPVVMNYRTMFAYNLEPEIFNLDVCRSIIEEGRKLGVSNYPVHIKIDTGMHRLGFLEEQLPELAKLLSGQTVIKASTVFSHLAVADMPDEAMDRYTLSQFAYFDRCCSILSDALPYPIKRHILNTAGILRFPEHQHDMVRLGIGLYGVSILNNGTETGIKPVSSLHTVIISIKEWDADTTIGYGRRGVLHRRSRIATIPIGYADGMNRHLGNGNFKVWINGTLCPTVGNICMDVCMIDVTDAQCREGDSVEIFGDHIPVSTISDILGTIPYEVLTSVSRRIKRIYYRE